MNNNHINISMELKVVQKKLQDYPDQVKMDLTKSAESEFDFCSIGLSMML